MPLNTQNVPQANQVDPVGCWVSQTWLSFELTMHVNILQEVTVLPRRFVLLVKRRESTGVLLEQHVAASGQFIFCRLMEPHDGFADWQKGPDFRLGE
jgi:hypothetical protein